MLTSDMLSARFHEGAHRFGSHLSTCPDSSFSRRNQPVTSSASHAAAPPSSPQFGEWKATFVDANPTLSAVFSGLHRADDLPLRINRQPDITSAELPALLAGVPIAIVDHTFLPT